MTSESQEQADRRPNWSNEPEGQINTFRVIPTDRPPLPAFAAVRDLLPIPVLPQFPDWVATYWSAWESVWSQLRNPPAGSPLISPVLVSEPGSPAELYQTAIVARLAGFVMPGFDLIHLLDNFYSAQLDDGYIPRELDLHTGKACFPPFDPNSTAPNLLAWTEWRHFRLTGDDTRLREVFRPIAGYHRWLRLHRTWQSGLYWTTGYASGNAGQTCVPDGTFHHGHWSWLAPTLQANMSALLLARMAERLGDPTATEDMTAERTKLRRQINDLMWNESTHFYHPTGPHGEFTTVRSMAAFWALLDRQLVPEERSKVMVQALRDEHNARRKAAIGTDSDSGEPDAGEEALQPITYTPLSMYVALRSLQTAGAWSLAHGSAVDHLTEYGPALTGEKLPPVTAAVVIGMILEQVIGLRIDWPLRQVSWHNYLGHDEEVGVRHIRVGDEGTADLLAADGVLTVRTDAPFTINYRDSEQDFQSAVPAGISAFDLR